MHGSGEARTEAGLQGASCGQEVREQREQSLRVHAHVYMHVQAGTHILRSRQFYYTHRSRVHHYGQDTEEFKRIPPDALE